jgi:CheY-like chemotaxis protein
MALVLVIDDNDGLRAVVRLTLETAGHEVIEAADGRQGLVLLGARGPDVMVTDILMPTKEGLETIREARAARPLLAIVAMSGGGGMESLDLLRIALEFGADKVLEKPFRSAELRDAVAEVLRAHAEE